MQKSVLMLLVLSLFSFAVHAEITRSQLTSDIASREPTDDLGDKVTIAPTGVTSVYFFTHVEAMAGKQLVHRWYFEGEEMAAVNLRIGGNSWRTYSSKKILPEWQGQWQVQVWHEDLQLLSHSFTVSAE